MTKYINANKAAKIAVNYATNYEPCLSEYEEGCADTWENAANFIEHFESEDAAPVVHAHWIARWDFYENKAVITCSKCGRSEKITLEQSSNLYNEFPYCHCGAKMQEKEGK